MLAVPILPTDFFFSGIVFNYSDSFSFYYEAVDTNFLAVIVVAFFNAKVDATGG